MFNVHHRCRRVLSMVAVLGAVGVAGIGLRSAAQAEKAHVIPAPAQDEAVGQATSEVAVFAGGCFWGVQGVYQHIKGVTSALSGYAGGDERTAEYEMVGTGRTGHAESARIVFDP